MSKPPLHPKAQAYFDSHKSIAERELERSREEMLALIDSHKLSPQQAHMVLADVERAHARRLMKIEAEAHRMGHH